ncbi:MAG: Mpo1-like protein [Steroidobacteraceae bacterium]
MERSQFASFREFYPYYLQQHTNSISRRLHVGGTLLAVAAAIGAVVTGRWRWLLAVPFAGYLPAWIGHALFERNSPATLRHPLYSLRGDFTLLLEVLSGRRDW